MLGISYHCGWGFGGGKQEHATCRHSDRMCILYTLQVGVKLLDGLKHLPFLHFFTHSNTGNTHQFFSSHFSFHHCHSIFTRSFFSISLYIIQRSPKDQTDLGGALFIFCEFSPRLFGEDDSHFDLGIFFKWVGSEKPPTSMGNVLEKHNTIPEFHDPSCLNKPKIASLLRWLIFGDHTWPFQKRVDSVFFLSFADFHLWVGKVASYQATLGCGTVSGGSGRIRVRDCLEMGKPGLF